MARRIRFKSYVVDITPSGLAHTARTGKTLADRLTAAWALRELIGLIRITPEHKKPAAWKGW